MRSLVADLDITDFANMSDPSLHFALAKMQNITARGEGKSPQPIFIVQGLSDASVLPQVVETAYNASCQSGNEVHLQTYPGIDHDPVIPAPVSRQRADAVIRRSNRLTLSICTLRATLARATALGLLFAVDFGI